MILKLILHVLDLDCGHARQYAGKELSKSWALFYMCWCWTVALQSFRSPSVAIKARVCPATCYRSLLSLHRKATGSQPPSRPLLCLGALHCPSRCHQPSSKGSWVPWLAFCSTSHFRHHYNPTWLSSPTPVRRSMNLSDRCSLTFSELTPLSTAGKKAHWFSSQLWRPQLPDRWKAPSSFPALQCFAYDHRSKRSEIQAVLKAFLHSFIVPPH